jgi:hypothetical protein
LQSLPTAKLFAVYGEILREMPARGVIGSANAAAADYAEYIVVRAFPGPPGSQVGEEFGR